MNQVLITISRGIIQQAIFFDNPKMAVQALSKYVKGMNVEHDDAALYDSAGLIANAKHFLDDDEQYFENKLLINEVSEERNESIYFIINPRHTLGFMVASPDDPLGYKDPIEALSELGQMRKNYGNHLKLYRAVPVKELITYRADVEKCNDESDVEDFDYDLIEEYLF